MPDAASLHLSPVAVAWLREIGRPAAALRPMTGDVSQRSYWRAELTSGGTAIVVHYPAAVRDECERFRMSGRLLAGAGVRVPAVLAADCALGLMLVEDLGERTLYETAGHDARGLAAYFGAGAAIVDTIERLDPGPIARLNPPLDGALLRRELAQTVDAFLAPRGLCDGDSGPALASAFDALCEHLSDRPTGPCHRDFMVRNLVPIGTPPGLAVLDHQGLRLGPPRYDLASLLNDSLFLPDDLQEELLAERLRDDGDWLDYRRAAAQRTLKAVGTYAAFAQRGIARHLPLIPPTFERALRHLRAVPETRRAAGALAHRWKA